MFLAANQGVTTDEVVLLGLDGHGEADTGLQRSGLVVELGASEDQAGLDAEHVECLESQGCEALWVADGPDRVPHLRSVRWVAEHLESQLTGVAGA